MCSVDSTLIKKRYSDIEIRHMSDCYIVVFDKPVIK